MHCERGTSELPTMLRRLALVVLVAWAIWGLFQLPADDESVALPENEQGEAAAPGLLSAARERADAASAADGHEAPANAGSVRDVTIHVVDPAGQPAAELFVQWRQHGAHGRSGNTDSQGRILLPKLDTTRHHRLQIFAWRLGEDVLPYDNNGWMPADGTIRLDRSLRITGTVLDENDDPATEFGVFYRAVGGDLEVHPATLAANGVFRIAPLSAGRYQVCAVINNPWRPHAPVGFISGDLEDSAYIQTVDAGALDVVLRVRRGVVLRAKIQDWDVPTMRWGQRVTLSDANGDHYFSELDHSGRVAFCRLPGEGRYRLRLLGLPGNRYLDEPDLATGEVVHAVKTRSGAQIHGHLVLPADGRPDRVSIQAWPLALGSETVVGPAVHAFVVQGTVDATTSRYLVQGLSRGRWLVRATTHVLRDGVKTALTARDRASAGEILDLTLRPE